MRWVGVMRWVGAAWLCAASVDSLAQFHSTISGVHPGDGAKALDEALTLLALERGGEAAKPDLAFVCVGTPFEGEFEALVDEAFERTRARVCLGILGAGVMGGGREREMAPCVSVSAGTLPPGSIATPFVFDGAGADGAGLRREDHRETERVLRREGTSCLLFGDPFGGVTEVAALVDSWIPSAVVVGGISCPAGNGASLAIREIGSAHRLPKRGAVAGLALRGPNLEVHALTAQGAVGVGGTFGGTGSSAGNVVGELDGEPALERLKDLLKASADKNPRVARLLQDALLVGLGATEGGDKGEPDFLIRQVLGATTGGELVVGDPSIVEGETKLKFHVRDGEAALEDLEATLRRYALERQFLAPGARPILSFLVSCAGRGEGLFGEAGVDSAAIAAAIDAPVCGFFANGELGPVGARIPPRPGADTPPIPSYLHGFTATAAILCDTTPREPDAAAAAGG